MTTLAEIEQNLGRVTAALHGAETVPDIIIAYERVRGAYRAIQDYRRVLPFAAIDARSAYECHMRTLRLLIEAQMRFSQAYHDAQKAGAMWRKGDSSRHKTGTKATLTKLGYKAGRSIKGFRRLWEAETKFPGLTDRTIADAMANNVEPSITLLEVAINTALGREQRAPHPPISKQQADINRLKLIGQVIELRKLWRLSTVAACRQFLHELGVTDKAVIDRAVHMQFTTVKNFGAGIGRSRRRLPSMSSLPNLTYDDVMKSDTPEGA